jgi:uncharacterized protein involved in tolerance to divalent cations
MPSDPDMIIITVTYPDAALADEMAQKLVNNQLAACVQYFLIKSVYRWQGQVERGDEYRLEIKTLAKNYAEIETVILDHHPYDCPEIIGQIIDKSSDDYCHWVANHTN